MKRYRMVLGISVFAFAAILVGQTAPTGCVTPSSLWLIDAAGTEVGLVLDREFGGSTYQSGQYYVYNAEFGWFLRIQSYSTLRDAGLPLYQSAPLLMWESDDCTGQGYFYSIHNPNEEIFYDGRQDKYYVATGVTEFVEVHSRWAVDICRPELEPVVLRYATLMEEYTGELPSFTPPYHVELR